MSLIQSIPILSKPTEFTILLDLEWNEYADFQAAMNKITPSRIAIFSSEMMMKKKSIVVVSSTDEAPGVVRLVASSTHQDELAPDLTVVEHRDVQPGPRSLVRLLLRRWDASAAVLPFPESARRDRRFC